MHVQLELCNYQVNQYVAQNCFENKLFESTFSADSNLNNAQGTRTTIE